MATPSSPGIPRSDSTSPPPATIPDRPASPEVPLTMSASAILIAQPRDVASALSSAGEYPSDKVVVKFKAVGSAPSLARGVAKISSTQTFHTVIWYLRKRLKLQDTDSVFCYVNDSFAPSLDEIVGNLHSCFKDSSGQLVISYAMNPAFG
ncbi:ubiquitin-like autophagy protein Apg12 [Colletotrichum godetiae]|uniref:Ubiquitin-like protein ATG12 n=1 Tax=Colletotrichum godetiae TaxID=1209918 RepID=A0AAJ0AJP4_9PEZI|nr:ubiquitin-like autophagy protein Apg12 [Colletotrichum godetiae]KAK1672961.1 ubiquitin-like autophagy protein Apg12 [Colletotrichum godetiae]